MKRIIKKIVFTSFFAPAAENTLDPPAPPAEKLTEGKLNPEKAGTVEEKEGVVVDERGKEKEVEAKEVGKENVD